MTETNITETNQNFLKIIFKILTIILTIIAISFIAYAFNLGLFKDENILINYIKKSNILAPIIFIALQLLQVIIPILPGGLSSFVGVILFGPFLGFIYNYVSLSIGSCIAFYLSKKYGIKLIKKLFKEQIITKYTKYLENNNFKKIFLISIILPGFPDDLLCYIAGISNMKFKTFFTIIIIGKPISLLIYSLFINIL